MADTSSSEVTTNGSEPGREELVAAARAVLVLAAERDAGLRALGGVAIAIRCPAARPPGALTRAYSDLDFVACKRDSQGVAESFAVAGFEPAERFNAVQAGRRMRFDHPRGYHADVFLDEFSMCHVLRLSNRLGIHDQTVSLADLLLTKLQVAKLNAKDVGDVAALLLDHPVTSDESGINWTYVAGLLGGDWGWWRTATETLSRVAVLGDTLPLSAEDMTRITERAATLEEHIAAAPKGVRWRARARLGERRPWREDPEDLGG